MADLLVVGNGFDLYHGLPTRYTDFLSFIENWFVFWENYRDDISCEKDDQFSVRLSETNEIISDTMLDFASHHGAYKCEHLEFINNHIDNLWIQYFMKKQLDGVNWMDFEAEIYNVLKLVEEYYTEYIPEVYRRNIAPIQYMSKDLLLIADILKRKCPVGYEDLAQKISWLDVEGLNKNKKALLKVMKSELDDLIRCFEYYLWEFVSRIRIEQYSEQIKELPYDLNLLNFNYTYTYATVYGKRKLRQHHRVHGDWVEEDMVLGIPDEAFPDSLDYICFQKYFQRIQKRIGNYYRDWIVGTETYTQEDEEDLINVYIMGHSLADSDKGILKDIFLNDFVKKVTVYYHSQSAYEQQIINLVAMFGKDYVIEQTAKGRICFEKLKSPQKGSAR